MKNLSELFLFMTIHDVYIFGGMNIIWLLILLIIFLPIFLSIITIPGLIGKESNTLSSQKKSYTHGFIATNEFQEQKKQIGNKSYAWSDKK